MTQGRRTTRRAGSGTRRRTTSRGVATAPRRRARTTRSTAYRRRRPTPAATLGAALGTLVVATLTGAPWPVRVALVAVSLGLVGGYLLWSRSGRSTPSTSAPDPAPAPDPRPRPDPRPAPTTDPAPTSEDQR